jgi:hypothetical protein
MILKNKKADGVTIFYVPSHPLFLNYKSDGELEINIINRYVKERNSHHFYQTFSPSAIPLI